MPVRKDSGLRGLEEEDGGVKDMVTHVLVSRSLDEARGRQGNRVGTSLLRDHILRPGPLTSDWSATLRSQQLQSASLSTQLLLGKKE